MASEKKNMEKSQGAEQLFWLSKACTGSVGKSALQYGDPIPEGAPPAEVAHYMSRGLVGTMAAALVPPTSAPDVKALQALEAEVARLTETVAARDAQIAGLLATMQTHSDSNANAEVGTLKAEIEKYRNGWEPSVKDLQKRLDLANEYSQEQEAEIKKLQAELDAKGGAA